MSPDDKLRGILATYEKPPLVHTDDYADDLYWVGWKIPNRHGAPVDVRLASGMPEFVAEWFVTQLSLLHKAD